MSVHVNPKIEMYSDCTSCCPRILKIWFCCCCKVDQERIDEEERIHQASIRALEAQESARTEKNDSHRHKKERKKPPRSESL